MKSNNTDTSSSPEKLEDYSDNTDSLSTDRDSHDTLSSLEKLGVSSDNTDSLSTDRESPDILSSPEKGASSDSTDSLSTDRESPVTLSSLKKLGTLSEIDVIEKFKTHTRQIAKIKNHVFRDKNKIPSDDSSDPSSDLGIDISQQSYNDIARAIEEYSQFSKTQAVKLNKKTNELQRHVTSGGSHENDDTTALNYTNLLGTIQKHAGEAFAENNEGRALILGALYKQVTDLDPNQCNQQNAIDLSGKFNRLKKFVSQEVTEEILSPQPTSPVISSNQKGRKKTKGGKGK